MKKIFFAALLAALSATSVDAAKVTYYGGMVTYLTETDYGQIEISFKKCMANNLFTFYNVKLDGVLVNSAQYSDNIGPFFVNGYWMGGNHSASGGSTANTVAYTITLDGQKVIPNRPTTGDVLEITVENELLYADGKKFCTEMMSYRVSGNSIEVWGEHTFTYPTVLPVSRYYGAQSMFVANEVLLPGSKNKNWVNLSNLDEVDVFKSEAPEFSTFVEHNANGYQAVLKYREGMGDAAFSTDPVYLYRKYGGSGKSYHVMMWDHNVKPGDTTRWHALYTWFIGPVEDTFRTGASDPKFVYQSYINGEPTEITVGADGKSTEPTAGIEDIIVDIVNAFASAGEGQIVISESAPDACCYDLSGKLIHKGAGSFNCPAGIYIVNDMHGHSVKLYVK